MRQEEHQSQCDFFTWTELHERYHPGLARFFAIPNGGARHPVVAGKLKKEGVRRGVPDVMNLTQGEGTESGQRFEYAGLVFEFKSSTGKLSPEQKDWCEYFREQGFRVEVPRSWVEAALITIDYFGLPESLKKNLPVHRIEPGIASPEEEVVGCLLSNGFKPDDRRRFRIPGTGYFVTVAPRVTRVYTPGANGEEGFFQNIQTRDLQGVKVAVAMIVEEQA